MVGFIKIDPTETAPGRAITSQLFFKKIAMNFDDHEQRISDALTGESVQIGSVINFGFSPIPSAYLFCDGSAVSRTTYAALFATIGLQYGIGDGSTTFNLPDRRGRVGVGVGGVYLRGDKAGTETHILTTSQIPAHTHTGSSHQHIGNIHGHNVGAAQVVAGGPSPIAAYWLTGSTAPGDVSTTFEITNVSATVQSTNVNAQSEGSSTAHENMHPFITYGVGIKF